MKNILLILLIAPLYLFSQTPIDFNELLYSNDYAELEGILSEYGYERTFYGKTGDKLQEWEVDNGNVRIWFFSNPLSAYDFTIEYKGIDGTSKFATKEFQRFRNFIKTSNCKYREKEELTERFYRNYQYNFFYSCDAPTIKWVEFLLYPLEKGEMKLGIYFSPSTMDYMFKDAYN